MEKYIISVIQMRTGSNKHENLEKAEYFINESAKRGAKLVALPELFNFLEPFDQGMDVNQAESIPGETSRLLTNLAKKNKIYIHGGSFLEKVENNSNKAFNTNLFIDREGNIIGKYRKIHLANINLKSDSAVVLEKEAVNKGDKIVVVETELGKMGLTTCFDIRFPELYRILALKGAEIIFAPSAFTIPTGKDHWDVLLRARAIENQLYIVAPAQYTSFCYGRSIIVDPWGIIISRAPDREGIITAEIDIDLVSEIREKIPCFRSREPKVYKDAWKE